MPSVTAGPRRLCLNMIVKDEAGVIERCLTAAAPYLDCYVICDTGSTDDTVERIRAFFAERNIPGMIVRTVFENFEQARNTALEAARTSDLNFDYLLLCDADMELVVERPDFRSELTGAPYMVAQRNSTLEYPNLRLLPRHLPARYRGVTHEYLDAGAAEKSFCDGIWFSDHADGHNRPDKYERDIALLTAGLRAEPDNARYVFYLANTHFDNADPAQAMQWYERRIQMGGWPGEVFYSSYRIGLCLQQLSRHPEMIARHLQTYQDFPDRAEPLHALARHYQENTEYHLSYLIASAASKIPLPENALFVEPDVYSWRLLDIVAVSAYWTGRVAESTALNRWLLEVVPESHRERITANLGFCLNAQHRAK